MYVTFTLFPATSLPVLANRHLLLERKRLLPGSCRCESRTGAYRLGVEEGEQCFTIAGLILNSHISRTLILVQTLKHRWFIFAKDFKEDQSPIITKSGMDFS